MAIDDQTRLVISLEARTKAAENGMKNAAAQIDKSLERIQKQFAETNKKMVLKAPVIKGAGMGGMFGDLKGLAGGFALAAGARELQQYADAWTTAGNKIAAAGSVAGRQGRSLEDLNKIASRSRTGIEETADLYAKLLRATKDVAKSEEEVARATEIANKAFKAGGASASEQAAGVLQLGQALGSGVLQGDELRSLRENAPLIAQAIADEFQTTIAGLKELGANGELTSDRVFKAILSAQPQIERAFATTNATIADSFTLLSNSITEAVGKLNELSGAGAGVGKVLSGMATAIDNLVDIVERLADTPAGDFAAWFAESAGNVDTLTSALNTLKPGLGDIIKLLTTPNAFEAPTLAQETAQDAQQAVKEVEVARKRIDRLMSSLLRGAGKTGGVSITAKGPLADLQELLKNDGIGVEDAKKRLAEILGDAPGTSEVHQRFAALIDELKKVQKEAKDAKLALDITSGKRTADPDDMAAQRGVARDSRARKAFEDKTIDDAMRTDLEKKVDERTQAILKAAKEIEVSLTEAAARILAQKTIAIESRVSDLSKSRSSTAETIKGFENYSPTAYPDYTIRNGKRVNSGYRVGYGSGEMTAADGTVTKVMADSVVSLEEAVRDLDRRIGEFQEGIADKIGADKFMSMNEGQQSALTSIAYNYGQLPDQIVKAILGGDTGDVYNAIKALGTDNGGINKARRNEEADMYLTGASPDVKARVETANDAAKDAADRKADFEARLKQEQQELDMLKEETGLRANLNPLIDDHGKALSTLEKAQKLLAYAQDESTASGKELSGVQQLLYGDLTKLTPEAQKEAEAMRKIAFGSGEATAALNVLDEAQEKLQQSLADSAAFGKDVFGGFIKDMIAGKSATEALSNALQKVADRLLDIGLNMLFDGPGGKAGGGPLGGLFSFLFAKDGGTINAAHARSGGAPARMKRGGRVRGPGGPRDDKVLTLLSNGEHVTRAAMARKHGALLDAINGDTVGRMADGGWAGAVPQIRTPGIPQRQAAAQQGVKVDVGVSMDDNGKLQAYVRDVSLQTTRSGISQYDAHSRRTFAGRMAEAQIRDF
jgi:tape measure domain-containing protein